MKLSKHSKKRLIERANIRNNQKLYFRTALKKGKTWYDIKDKKLRTYLKSKQRVNSRIKLYDNKLFIYSKNKKQLYTIYELPTIYRHLE